MIHIILREGQYMVHIYRADRSKARLMSDGIKYKILHYNIHGNVTIASLDRVEQLIEKNRARATRRHNPIFENLETIVIA